jgi:RNA polymerase sigma factor (sigma-70 family)
LEVVVTVTPAVSPTVTPAPQVRADLPPFQRVLDEHAAALHRFVVAQVGPHDGADCFQEAVVAALRAYPGLRDASNLRGWLFTIAHRKVIDLHRGTGRRAVPVEAPPERAVQDRDATGDDDLWAAVRRLPPKQRGAVALRYLHDLPYAEIGAILDCSEAAARQSVRAGLTALRQEVQL